MLTYPLRHLACTSQLDIYKILILTTEFYPNFYFLLLSAKVYCNTANYILVIWTTLLFPVMMPGAVLTQSALLMISIIVFDTCTGM